MVIERSEKQEMCRIEADHHNILYIANRLQKNQPDMLRKERSSAYKRVLFSG